MAGEGIRKTTILGERLRRYARDQPAIYGAKKRLQIYTGRRPTLFYGLYRQARKNPKQAVGPETELVIEGFPRSANTFAVVAFRQAQNRFVNIASNLHVPAQVIRAARLRIPALVLIRPPRDAVLSLLVRDPISVNLALRQYVSFYEAVTDYRNAYVLGHFKEVTCDYGTVIKRINEKFGTDFCPFYHDERNVRKVFDRIDEGYRKRYDEASLPATVSRPSGAREEMKRRVEHELHRARHEGLVSEAEAVYRRLTGPEE